MSQEAYNRVTTAIDLLLVEHHADLLVVYEDGLTPEAKEEIEDDYHRYSAMDNALRAQTDFNTYCLEQPSVVKTESMAAASMLISLMLGRFYQQCGLHAMGD